MSNEAKYPDLVVPGVHPDEPLFLLRAQDVAALATLQQYKHECALRGAADEHLEAITNVVERFDAWRLAHPELMKVPD